MFRLLAVEHDPDTVGVVTSFELENFFVQREKKYFGVTSAELSQH
jgi:hypothetical protein